MNFLKKPLSLAVNSSIFSVKLKQLYPDPYFQSGFGCETLVIRIVLTLMMLMEITATLVQGDQLDGRLVLGDHHLGEEGV